MIHTDILVIGSGAAGLFYALKTAHACPMNNITVITKASPEESNTKYAQGGVAVVLDKVKDNFKNHIEDTLVAGDGICNPDVVEMVVKDAPDRINDLIELGVNFDIDHEGEYDLGREGGHSQHRVIHHKDNTGEAIEIVLLKKVGEYSNITLLDHHLAFELILSDTKSCLGVRVLDQKEQVAENIYSQVTVLATGGCGSVYETTTNPSINTGDGIALALKAGASINNMQFIQFHPTVVYEEAKGKLALVTEALRGAGAKLRNVNKELFMSRYDRREELAPRDIVSRAIHNEMMQHNSKFVYLDCTAVDREVLTNHFPNIYKDCKNRGYNLYTDLLPITPAAHYLCGGIDVDKAGKTSVENLFAIGECSNTGLHGANRLASNSLLEALVYGYRASLASVSILVEKERVGSVTRGQVVGEEYSVKQLSNEQLSKITELRDRLNAIMSRYVGIVRTNVGLQKALVEMKGLKEEFCILFPKRNSLSLESLELRNMLCVCKVIIEQSIDQKINKGTFYNTDLNENR